MDTLTPYDQVMSKAYMMWASGIRGRAEVDAYDMIFRDEGYYPADMVKVKSGWKSAIMIPRATSSTDTVELKFDELLSGALWITPESEIVVGWTSAECDVPIKQELHTLLRGNAGQVFSGWLKEAKRKVQPHVESLAVNASIPGMSEKIDEGRIETQHRGLKIIVSLTLWVKCYCIEQIEVGDTSMCTRLGVSTLLGWSATPVDDDIHDVVQAWTVTKLIRMIGQSSKVRNVKKSKLIECFMKKFQDEMRHRTSKAEKILQRRKKPLNVERLLCLRESLEISLNVAKQELPLRRKVTLKKRDGSVVQTEVLLSQFGVYFTDIFGATPGTRYTLKGYDRVSNSQMWHTIFLTDLQEIIEAPTYWTVDQADNTTAIKRI